ncbi:UNVERIFIED_CONTAM: hypothetical protein K2H54_056040 [Gekko kuhli]
MYLHFPYLVCYKFNLNKQMRRSVKNLWKNNVDRMAYRDGFIAEWRKLTLDVVLCPALGPAFNLGYAGKLFGTI